MAAPRQWGLAPEVCLAAGLTDPHRWPFQASTCREDTGKHKSACKARLRTHLKSGGQVTVYETYPVM